MSTDGDTKPKTLALDEQRARLERRANVIRSRLLRTVDALDARRHQVQDIGHQVKEIGQQAKRLAKPVSFSILGAAAVVIGSALAIRAVVESRRERHFSYRLSKALAPFRAPPPQQTPLWREALRSVTLSVLGIVATELAKRYSVTLLAPPPPPPAPPQLTR